MSFFVLTHDFMVNFYQQAFAFVLFRPFRPNGDIKKPYDYGCNQLFMIARKRRALVKDIAKDFFLCCKTSYLYATLAVKKVKKLSN